MGERGKSMQSVTWTNGPGGSGNYESVLFGRAWRARRKIRKCGAEKSVSDGLAALAGSELGKKNEVTRNYKYIHEHTKHQLGLLLSYAERKISARRCCVRQESSR